MATRQTAYRYIERVPGVVGGDPKIKGTRVPVWIIVCYWRTHGAVADITEAYPQVSIDAAKEAFAYYEANREEIDETIAENEALAYDNIADE